MKSLLRHVAKRWIIGNPVKIRERFEGQGITEGNCYLLGCRAGPETSVEYLLHEMAHLSERELPKVLERPYASWGFSRGKYWEVYGQSGYEPQTDQSVMREARTWSFQLSLMRELGLEITAQELVESAVYLPAFCNFKFKAVPSWKDKSYRDSEQAAKEILAQKVEEETSIYSFNEWEKRWFERMNALKA
jgi:hypothetical protein